MDTAPALVSILRQGAYLIASIHTALDDSQMVRFQEDLVEQIGQHRSRGVIIDVAALDVMDSFGSKTLRNIGEMARLRGATTVIVGIQPDVAFAMVNLGMGTGSMRTALDLEAGLDSLASSGRGASLLAGQRGTSRSRRSPRPARNPVNGRSAGRTTVPAGSGNDGQLDRVE